MCTTALALTVACASNERAGTHLSIPRRGRTRMPRSEADFRDNNFKLQLVDKYPEGSPAADAMLPEALTCFFLLKLPKYSSSEVLEAKLRYAVTNCKAIDSDSYARTSLPEEH
eukprot:TRINITY_DN10762_c0_g3_i2.p4 TRINITY_DN10762_c0_g3~~TRINITY_DN10762_c0_g3_i2.p4  ORF type:complete len:113 (+),score=23.85 TRINITY_DN10762_c0_g3_i2:3787-4125(+)